MLLTLFADPPSPVRIPAEVVAPQRGNRAKPYLRVDGKRITPPATGGPPVGSGGGDRTPADGRRCDHDQRRRDHVPELHGARDGPGPARRLPRRLGRHATLAGPSVSGLQRTPEVHRERDAQEHFQPEQDPSAFVVHDPSSTRTQGHAPPRPALSVGQI